MKRTSLLWLALVSCQSVPLAPEPTPPRLHLREANVLLRPVAGGEELLGREVTPSAAGRFSIAPELAPGCRVAITRKETSARERSRAHVRSYAAFEADYLNLVELGLDTSDIEEVVLDVQQSAVLRASLAGPCGARVITTVYVGHGKQSFHGKTHGKAKGNVGIEGVGLRVGGESEHQIGESMHWDTPSAYAFEERTLQTGSNLIIRANLPSTLQEGQLLQVSFTASRPAFLIVFGENLDGKRELLWPSNEEPAPQATMEQPAIMPSKAERDAGYVYRLRLGDDASQPTRESLVVYGIVEKGDFDLVHPQVIGGGADYESLLREKLEHMPASRWSRYTFHYVIQPAAASVLSKGTAPVGAREETP